MITNHLANPTCPRSSYLLLVPVNISALKMTALRSQLAMAAQIYRLGREQPCGSLPVRCMCAGEGGQVTGLGRRGKGSHVGPPP